MQSLCLPRGCRQASQSYNTRFWRATHDRRFLARTSRPQLLLESGASCCASGGLIRSPQGNKARSTVRPVASSLSQTESEASSASQSTTRQAGTLLGQVYLTLLPGPLRYAPALLFPATALASVVGASWGHEGVHAVVSLLPATQMLEWAPFLTILQQVYSSYPQECNVVMDTALSLIGAAFTFIVLPAGDLLLGQDTLGPEVESELAPNVQTLYRKLLYTIVLLHWTVLLLGCWAVANLHVHPLACLGLALSLGAEGGLCFTTAHELLHGRSRLDKLMAQALLCSVGYMHWSESHHIHHRKVATPADPATARKGESVYMFVPRSVIGNLQDGWVAETTRLRKRSIPFFSPQNRLLLWLGAPVSALGGVFVLWGPWSCALAIAQALVGILLLEMVNYIEHYGLLRQRLASGRYEGIAVRHSWNANWLLSNCILLRLQRHSDHHAHADRPYQMLRDIPEAPQLPASYPAMMVLSLLPGYFRWVMDPRVAACSSQISGDPHVTACSSPMTAASLVTDLEILSSEDG
ncbi:hypothetical protein WJX73_001214 [Symbiochloris irregularis]|uniref:Fatty acid desaturase domain-containing protein n=1 Tax=Symbiochloris irregularis TaxID=706552 RepID=A0AAW1P7H4_9CHLO